MTVDVPERLQEWIRGNPADVYTALEWLRRNPHTWALLVETARLEMDVDAMRGGDE